MWSNGKDVNELGQSILLLQPIDNHHNGKRRKPAASATSSHIGGSPCFYDNDPSFQHFTNPKCSLCDQYMYLLLQLHAPVDDLDRTLYFFGCNRSTCHSIKNNSLKDSRFHAYLGGGAVRCFRSQQALRNIDCVSDNSASAKVRHLSKLEENDWGDGDWESNTDDKDWDCGDGDQCSNKEISMDDLESMISKCEMKSSSVLGRDRLLAHTYFSKSTDIAKEAINSTKPMCNLQFSTNLPEFKSYDLDTFDEPPISKKIDANLMDDEDDEDYEYISNLDSTKVNQMLSRYLAIEDDEEILSVLKHRADTLTNRRNPLCSKGDTGERYERIPPEELAFNAFCKRLKRAPKQVVRYAYGGIPMWSIPIHDFTPDNSGTIPKNSVQTDSDHHHQTSCVVGSSPTVPCCICGAERIFEFQVLPTILHVLAVDSFELKEGGMNWGSIAVYSCPNSCDNSREEFVLVQNGDDIPAS